MSCAAIALSTDTWNAEAYGTTSAVFRASASVAQSISGHLRWVSLAKDFWSIDRQLKALLESFYREAAKPVDPAACPTEESLRSSLAMLRTLCEKIEDLYAAGKSNGLTNRSIIGTSLNSIRVRGDELMDIVEGVQLSLSPQDFEPSFTKALDEYRKNETFDLASIK